MERAINTFLDEVLLLLLLLVLLTKFPGILPATHILPAGPQMLRPYRRGESWQGPLGAVFGMDLNITQGMQVLGDLVTRSTKLWGFLRNQQTWCEM